MNSKLPDGKCSSIHQYNTENMASSETVNASNRCNNYNGNAIIQFIDFANKKD